MATLFCCGAHRKARSHRLVSKDPDFNYQRLYVLEACQKCHGKKLQWRGENPFGGLSEFFDIDPHAYAQWERRIKAEEAKPELQLMSEYSERISSSMTAQIQYQTKLCQAKRWYKGERVG